VSAAHKALDAVAAAADPDRFAGVGIELEPIRSLDTGFYEDVFDRNERRLLEEAASLTGESRHAWYLSGWCAKEAIGKALGGGVLGGPRNMRLESVEPDSGLLTARALGALAREIEGKDPGLAARSIEARRSIHDGNVVALCLLPRGIA
jgi:phosphopantetheinyl transferase